jgi:tripartite-type tricarboxylate transporter receptor subunit TctC
MTGTHMTHVPYKGGGPALSDLLAGAVDLTFDNMATVSPQVQQGRLRVLGVASLERTPLAPDGRDRAGLRGADVGGRGGAGRHCRRDRE